MHSTLRLIAVLMPLVPAQFAMRIPAIPAASIHRLDAASTTRYSIQVPAGATKLSLSVNTTQNLNILVRFGQQVAMDDPKGFDYSFPVAAGQSTVALTPQSVPPLQAGTYYVAFTTPDQGSVSVSLSVSSDSTAPGPAAAQAPSVSKAGVLNAASFAPEIAAGSFVTIFGQNFTNQQLTWESAITDGQTLPVSLGGVRVRINGKDCFVNYVSPTQLNVLAPPDDALGTVAVEVTTPQGTAQSQATMVQYSPGFFTYPLSGKQYLAALFANTATIVAQSGALPGVDTRPAKSGDLLQLYATGLGATNPAPPAGQVLKQAYPVTDLSRVKVTVGGLPAEVLFAGMTFAGIFQVNVRVPAGVAAGDQPVVLTIEGRSTQAAGLLSFAQ